MQRTFEWNMSVMQPALSWRELVHHWLELSSWPVDTIDGAMVYLLDLLLGQDMRLQAASFQLVYHDEIKSWHPGASVALARPGDVTFTRRSSAARYIGLPEDAATRLRELREREVSGFTLSFHEDEHGVRAMGTLPIQEGVEVCLCFLMSEEIPNLLESTAAALSGGRVCLKRWCSTHGAMRPCGYLSPRVRQALLHLLTGESEEEIAEQMSITPGTLHQHVVTVYRSFGVRSRAELMALWLSGEFAG